MFTHMLQQVGACYMTIFMTAMILNSADVIYEQEIQLTSFPLLRLIKVKVVLLSCSSDLLEHKFKT